MLFYVCCIGFDAFFVYQNHIRGDKIWQIRKKIKFYLPKIWLLKCLYHIKYKKLIMYFIQFVVILADNFLIFNKIKIVLV